MMERNLKNDSSQRYHTPKSDNQTRNHVSIPTLAAAVLIFLSPVAPNIVVRVQNVFLVNQELVNDMNTPCASDARG